MTSKTPNRAAKPLSPAKPQQIAEDQLDRVAGAGGVMLERTRTGTGG